MKLQSWCALTVFTAACGSGGAGIDAGPDDAMIDAPRLPCWPSEDTVLTPTPGASIQLGTGEEVYEPMPPDPRVVYGSQGGFHIVVHARITSMLPGNPVDVSDPANPRTRFRAFFVDTGLPINPALCGIRLGYKSTSGGAELARSSAILFEIGLSETYVFGREVRVTAEIIDSADSYAKDEKTVILREPEGWTGPPG